MRAVQRTIEVNGLQLNYGEAGLPTGPPLVLVHGLAARWQTGSTLFPALSDRWHLYAPDMRGHGKSSRASGRYRLGELASDLIALLEAPVGAAPIYAHSLGGWVALMAAAERPELVRGIVVADTAIYQRHDVPREPVTYLSDIPLPMRAIATSQAQLDPEVITALRAGHLTHGYDADSILARVACPVLLLQANPELGGLMTDDDVARARIALPQATHVQLPALDHGLHVGDAGQVIDVIGPFFAGL